MAVWVCRAERGGAWASEFEKQGVISVGWLKEDIEHLSRAELTDRIAAGTTGHRSKASVPAGELWRFVHEITPGNTVITPDGTTRDLLIGAVSGPYEFHATPLVGDHHHYHRVTWEGRYPRDVLPQRLLYSLGSALTLFTFAGADEALRILRSPSVASSGDDAPVADDAEDPSAVITADTAARGRELIEHAIAKLDDNELELLVAGLLRAMGYFTRLAGEGADGGVDVRAARDPLFSERPFLKVQVKARPNTAMPPEALRALKGVLRDGDRGIFVSTGGFTPAALKESSDTLTLIDTKELRMLLVDYYERADAETKSLVPLEKVWYPAASRE